MADLTKGQYELSYGGRSVVFGKGTPVKVEQLELGDAELSANDYRRPRADGIGFGRDYRGGRLLVWEGDIVTRSTATQRAAGYTTQQLALDALEEIETMWDAEEVRLDPGAVAVLRMRRGSGTRRVYGRPRRFTPTTGNTYQGWIPVVFDFQTSDHVYYDDVEQSAQIAMVPEEIGGQQGPQIGPWIATGQGAGVARVEVGGTKPCWPVFRIDGPVVGQLVDPYIEVVGHWSFQLLGTINYDQFVVVDTTPWNRSIRRNDGANWSGKLSTTSQIPARMRIPPGPQTVLLKGTDPSLTGSCTVYWRDVFGSHA